MRVRTKMLRRIHTKCFCDPCMKTHTRTRARARIWLTHVCGYARAYTLTIPRPHTRALSPHTQHTPGLLVCCLRHHHTTAIPISTTPTAPPMMGREGIPPPPSLVLPPLTVGAGSEETAVVVGLTSTSACGSPACVRATEQSRIKTAQSGVKSR